MLAVTRLTSTFSAVGLALQEQLLPQDQTVPVGSTDWSLDALAVGDGTILRR